MIPAETVCLRYSDSFLTDQREMFSCRSIHTYNNSSNCEEHEGILLQERLDVLFGNLLHFPLCLHGAYVNALPDTLHPAVVNPNMSISVTRMCEASQAGWSIHV